ncbi:OmpH family outer membrane protein [Solimonas marina]|uniref:OmpH family outer membrane protein n=1 Tax=Solimonas marina TaxID=2714601 RepID=A0A970B9C8_9GAMM|nr:OmpH family outer membrane protein [Solimonas marina]NKF23199.1 OmpH family outer membrane protein [Solimonas marina]
MIRKFIAATGVLLAIVAMPAMAAELKIGVIRSADLAEQAPQFKAMQDQLKAQFERRQNDLEAEGKKLQDDIAAYQKEADMLSADDRAKREKDLTTRRIDLQSKGQQLQSDFNKSRQEQFSKTMQSIKDVIDAVAKDQGLDMILENPVYAKPQYDVTDEVLKRLKAGSAKK